MSRRKITAFDFNDIIYGIIHFHIFIVAFSLAYHNKKKKKKEKKRRGEKL